MNLHCGGTSQGEQCYLITIFDARSSNVLIEAWLLEAVKVYAGGSVTLQTANGDLYPLHQVVSAMLCSMGNGEGRKPPLHVDQLSSFGHGSSSIGGWSDVKC